MMFNVRLVEFALSLAVLGLPGVARAANETALQCAEQSEQAQRLRDEGKLEKARALFLACAAERCPSIINKDCTGWYVEVDARLPSVVLAAKDAAGHDLTDVSVFVDDATTPLVKSLDAGALRLDPGEHRLRFEAPGRVTTTTELLLRDGEKRRLVGVVLEPVTTDEARGRGPFTPSVVPVQTDRPVPWLSLGLGGVALVGAGTFAYFFASADQRHDELARTCAPTCDHDEVDDARTELLISHVALGIGITAAVGAVVSYVLAPKHAKTIDNALFSRTIRF